MAHLCIYYYLWYLQAEAGGLVTVRHRPMPPVSLYFEVKYVADISNIYDHVGRIFTRFYVPTSSLLLLLLLVR